MTLVKGSSSICGESLAFLFDAFINCHHIKAHGSGNSIVYEVQRIDWPDGTCYLNQYCYIVEVFTAMTNAFKEAK